MNIDKDVLYSFGAEDKSYRKGETVYKQDDHALYYYQILKGKVKLNNFDEDGREFIHNILGENQSFGDSMLFLEKYHPMNAVCLSDSEIMRLSKNSFFEMIKANPQYSLEMNACLSQRLYFKSVMMQSISSQDPMTRLKGLLDYLISYHDGECNQCFHVELTRQQMANLVGLRVETVVRALKKMEKEKKIKLEGRRILY